MCNFNYLCKLWIWCTTNIKKVKSIFFLSTFKRSYCPIGPFFLRYNPWLIWPTVGVKSVGTFSVILVKVATRPLQPQTKLNFEQMGRNDCGRWGVARTTRWAKSWWKNLSLGAESYVTITWKGFFTQSQILLSPIVWNWFRAKKNEIFLIFYY